MVAELPCDELEPLAFARGLTRGLPSQGIDMVQVSDPGISPVPSDRRIERLRN